MIAENYWLSCNGKRAIIIRAVESCVCRMESLCHALPCSVPRNAERKSKLRASANQRTPKLYSRFQTTKSSSTTLMPACQPSIRLISSCGIATSCKQFMHATWIADAAGQSPALRAGSPPTQYPPSRQSIEAAQMPGIIHHKCLDRPAQSANDSISPSLRHAIVSTCST